jgi:putative nucleotidyltransferase with HDIG domain
MKTAQPSSSDIQHDIPPPSTREQIAAAQETYKEAICSMERMFEELETGIVPRPDTLHMVVADVLTRVLDDDASMLSLLSFQKMKRFDRTLASHALDVCTLSLIVAHDYGVAEKDLEALGAGALLHDIDYVRLPRNLYRRSHDLTEQERTMMQQHAALGLAMLQEAKEDRNEIVRIVLEHHECSNGTGFPNTLTGDSISPLAQLVGLVDIYDGMVSRRAGRPAMLPHDAIRQLFRLGDTGPGPQGGSYITPIRVDLGAQTAGTMTRTITKVLDPLHERVNVAMFLDGIHEEAA